MSDKYNVLINGASGFVGLDINPTFTNGAFTGVTNLALRVQGNTEISRSGADTQLTIARGGGASLILQAKANSTSSSEGVNLYWTANTWLKFVLGSSVVANFSNVGNLLVGTSTDAGYKLDVIGSGRIKGAGTTSATTAFVVQNSLSSTTFSVRDDGRVLIPGSTVLQGFTQIGLIQFYPVLDGLYGASSTGRVLRVDTTFDATVSSTYAYQLGAFSLETGTASNINGTSIFTTLAPTSGSKTFTTLNVASTINATGTYSGIVRGIYYNPTLTSITGVTHRAIETTSGDVIFNGGNLTVDTNTLFVDATNDRVGIGTTSPTYKLEASSAGYTAFGIMSGANNNAEIHFQNTGYGLPRWTIRTTGTPNGSSGNLTFQRLGSTFPLTITSGDNVLIGFGTDAGYKLDVNGTVRIKGTGTTGSTIALSVQNNTPTTIFTIADDGVTTVNNPSTNVNTRFSGTTIDFYSFSTQLASIGKGNWNSNSTITFQASLTGSNDLRVGSSFVRARASLQVGNSDNSIINGSWTGKVLTLGNGLGNGEVTEITSANPTTFPASQSDIFFYGGVGSGGNAGDIFVQHNNTSKRGNLIIGTNTRTASAIVSIASTTQGFLQPRMTNAEALAITTPATGLQVYDTTNNKNLYESLFQFNS